MRIELRDVVASYGGNPVLRDVSLAVPAGELLALLGPSGCGKTTLLMAIAGFREAEAGQILLDGNSASGVPPRDREIGMVFQDLALWPHLTVEKHLEFVLKGRKVSAAERRARIAATLEVVELNDLAGRLPAALSGGEAQRLAVARALVARPKILLLDEPLGALDRRLRERMMAFLRRVHEQFKMTTITVTHDYDEALALADQVAVMHGGRVLQTGAPDEVYRRPADGRVAEITGAASLLAARREGDRVRLPWGAFPSAFSDGAGEDVTVVLRPEAVEVVDGEAGRVRASRFRSGRWEADVEIGGSVVIGWSARRRESAERVSLKLAEPLWSIKP
ncbi:MAG: ABC transporter ATP-binding protein [Planctomycetes bacterium]|nr:ABC transporter ATP-binding protein [Planctomycetota bacterium]